MAAFTALINSRTLSPKAQAMAEMVHVTLVQWPKIEEPEEREAIRHHLLRDIERLTAELSHRGI